MSSRILITVLYLLYTQRLLSWASALSLKCQERKGAPQTTRKGAPQTTKGAPQLAAALQQTTIKWLQPRSPRFLARFLEPPARRSRCSDECDIR